MRLCQCLRVRIYRHGHEHPVRPVSVIGDKDKPEADDSLRVRHGGRRVHIKGAHLRPSGRNSHLPVLYIERRGVPPLARVIAVQIHSAMHGDIRVA